MKKKLRILIALFAVYGVYSCGVDSWRFYQSDKCIDRGGVYDYNYDKCDYGK